MTARKEKPEAGNFWKTPTWVWEITKPAAIAGVLFVAGGIADRILIGNKVESMGPRLEYLEAREKITTRYIDEEKRRKDYDSVRIADRRQFYKEQLELQRRNDSIMRLDERKYDKEMIEAISKPIEIITR